MDIVPPVKVQLVQEAVLSTVIVTPGAITTLQLVQMGLLLKVEVLALVFKLTVV